jgi:excinuclease ABC subunit B
VEFNLQSEYKPTGDQPEAIRKLAAGVISGEKHQTLLGVTGSGKTFTIANVVQQCGKPTLVLSHNKTLAAQLFSEFKQFFPDNKVEYYVSYYDYYQPEAYLPVTGTYIEKDFMINDELERLRLSATSALISGRQDVIVVSSVSCIYGIGNPDEFEKNAVKLKVGQCISRDDVLRGLVDALYSRNEFEFSRGVFRVKGDTVDVYVAYDDFAYRVQFWGDEIDSISMIDPISGATIEKQESIRIFPANLFMTSKERLWDAIKEIQDDLTAEYAELNSIGKREEAERLKVRVESDLEMIREIGHCPGIENYSRYFDGRARGSRPFCLLDYFPGDFLLVVDESHVTLPQIRAMFGGDKSRKLNLVEHGFRLMSALDNRPLTFDEFCTLANQLIYVSATPADYELEACGGAVVEQIIRPTGLLDPPIEVRPSLNQIDDLVAEVNARAQIDERTLVTTLTKRMAEELSQYFDKINIKCAYIHSDVKTIERVEILAKLREGIFDVLIGVNLLREGLDLPEVSLVAILDADKEGFLRNTRSLTQTAGRAARNISGTVIMYADKITDSMQRTIAETNRRRTKQIQYNEENGLKPMPLLKRPSSSLRGEAAQAVAKYEVGAELALAMDPVVQFMDADSLRKSLASAKANMLSAAKREDFAEAARLRDEMYGLERLLDKKTK